METTKTEAEWLEEKIQECITASEEAQTHSSAYHYAARAETYNRIKNNTLVFGNSAEEAADIREGNYKPENDWYGMLGARIGALETYLDWKNGRLEE